MERKGAAKLQADREQFAAWRQQRKQRGPIPEALWRLAVGHVPELGLNQVSREFRVNYVQLKRKVEELGRGGGVGKISQPASANATRGVEKPAQSGFVELAWPAAGPSPSGGRSALSAGGSERLRLVLERGDGGRLSLEGGPMELGWLEGVLQCFYTGR